MKDKLWAMFARWMVSHPRLVDWIIRRAQRKPYTHLENYMRRWWVVRPSRWLPFSIRLHRILRQDLDRTPHNHPCAFRTIVLRGWYCQELLVPFGRDTVRTAVAVGPGDTYALTTDQYHRIAHVSGGGVWTLFIMGKKQGQWGFLVDGKHVNRQDYDQPV